eukprot:jgi/Hompol1/4827/HPOL_003987-RA
MNRSHAAQNKAAASSDAPKTDRAGTSASTQNSRREELERWRAARAAVATTAASFFPAKTHAKTCSETHKKLDNQACGFGSRTGSRTCSPESIIHSVAARGPKAKAKAKELGSRKPKPQPQPQPAIARAAVATAVPSKSCAASRAKRVSATEPDASKSASNGDDTPATGSTALAALSAEVGHIDAAEQRNREKLIQSGLFWPHGARSVVLRVIDHQGNLMEQTLLQTPVTNVFGVLDALQAAERGDVALSRAIFNIIATSPHNTTSPVKVFLPNGKSHIVKKPPSQLIGFWTLWASLEEDWGNDLAVSEIFDRAEDAVLLSSEKERLRTEQRLFSMRLSHTIGKSTVPRDYIDSVDEFDLEEPVPTITASDTPAKWSHLQATDMPCIEDESFAEDVSATPVHKLDRYEQQYESPDCLSKLTFDISNMSLNTFSARKTTAFAVEDARQCGLVTVLTPVRASRKDRELHGVDRVITPARRSTRHFKNTDNSDENGDTNVQATASESVSKLLEANGYAYVPNKVGLGSVLSLSFPMIPY